MTVVFEMTTTLEAGGGEARTEAEAPLTSSTGGPGDDTAPGTAGAGRTTRVGTTLKTAAMKVDPKSRMRRKPLVVVEGQAPLRETTETTSTNEPAPGA